MRKIIKMLSVLALTIFSFYYTDKVTNIIKNNDPIMKEILKSYRNFESKATNGTINGNTYIIGKSGKIVDINKSFNKMKKINNYNEGLYVFKEFPPQINISNNKDKYIIKGSNLKRNVSLIINVKTPSLIGEIIKVIEEKNINVAYNFENQNIINYNQNLDTNNEYLILNNNTNILNLAQLYEKNQNIFCFTKKENEELKKWCHKNQLYTIVPSIIINNDIQELKEKIENGSIIMIDIKTNNLDILKLAINYIRQKGYDIISLDNLIKE